MILTRRYKNNVCHFSNVDVSDSKLQRSFYLQSYEVHTKEFHTNLALVVRVLRRKRYDGYDI